MSGSSASLSAIDTRQDELRKKGSDFFEQFLEQARKGKDPLNADPKSRRKVDVEAAENEDLETVGRILPHIIGLLYFSSTTAQLVVAKRALQPLETPGVQVFLHLLPTLGATYCLTPTGPLSGTALRASSVQILIYFLQTVSLFGALTFSSLYLVLSWTTLVPAILAYALKMQNAQAVEARPGMLHALLLGIGLAGAAVALISQLWPATLGALCLAGWTAGEILKLAWQDFKAGDLNIPFVGQEVVVQLREIAEAEVKLSAGTSTFLCTTFSAVPALLVGLLSGEGSSIIDHELSVPAVSAILVSCAAWATAAVTGVLYFDGVSSAARHRLTTFTAVGALVLQILLNGADGALALAAAALAVVGGVGASQCR